MVIGRRGFTVVELTVMVVVFASLSAAVLINFSANRASQNLRAAADQLVEDIRRAQTLAYANQQQLICTADNLVCGSGSSCDPSLPAGCTNRYVSSYGVKFDTDGTDTKYALFADYATPGAYVNGEAVPNGVRTLPKNVVIQSVTPAANDPVVYVFNNLNTSPFVTCSSNCTTTITLTSTVTNATRTVIVQKQTGAVSVQ
jgi:type II secretory pathway pseudopilin PulG